MEMASHRIEVLLNFGGRPQSVSAVVDTVDHDWPVDDTDALIVRFEGGGIGHALDDPDLATASRLCPD